MFKKLEFTKRWINGLLCMTAAGLMMTVGCVAPETAAEFESGSDTASLDGAVIDDDGSTFEISMDDARNVLSRVDIDGGDRYIEFDEALSEQLGVSVPTAIGSGNNTLEINAGTGVATLTVDVPFSGPETFNFTTDDALGLFGLSDRAAMQNGEPCERSVAALDDFCGLFQANAPAALEDVIGLAQQFAGEAGVPGIANGFIEQVVTEFYDVLDDFCNAWTEVRDGSSEKDPVDPCTM